MVEHWMTAELRGANGSFQRAAREYAEEYAAMAVAAERERLQELLGEAACTLSMYFNSVPLDDEMKAHAIDVWKRCIDA